MNEIPKIEDGDFDQRPNSPGWLQPVSKREDGSWEKLKPIIRCNCGMLCGIGLHHVHADGTVTASFYHKKGTNTAAPNYEDPNGCEWHVYLKLKDYDGGDFPPGS